MAAALEQACPPASAREIGEWVEREAGEAVRTRADRLADVESRSSAIMRPGVSVAVGERPPPRPGAEGDTLTTSSVAEVPDAGHASRWSRQRRVATGLGGASLLAVSVVLALMLARSSAGPRDRPRPETATQAGPLPAPSESFAAVVPSTAQLAPSAPEPVAAASAATAAASKATPTVHPPVTHASAPRKPDCRNPFTLGKGGIRVPRPECF